MVKKTSYIIVLITVLMTMASCVTPRRINYLQDMTQGSQIELENRFEARIAPYDELTIMVTSSQLNPELADPFNAGPDGTSYLVDVNGDIVFPVLGKLHVAGLTRLRLQEMMTRMLVLGDYLDNPFVMVRFTSFKIFVLGGKKGQVLNIPNERCTFLEALAMIGGLDDFTRRDRIAVMREVDGKMVMRYLDPRSSNVFSDPFFMLQQNDFIIMESLTGGTLRQEVSYWVGLASTVMSAATFLLTLAVYRSSKTN